MMPIRSLKRSYVAQYDGRTSGRSICLSRIVTLDTRRPRMIFLLSGQDTSEWRPAALIVMLLHLPTGTEFLSTTVAFCVVSERG